VNPPRPNPGANRKPGFPAAAPKKRSKAVVVGTIVASFLGIGACAVATRDNGRCVDANETVVDRSQCDHHVPGTRIYYGGAGRSIGSKVTGGGYERGGFGHGFSSGHGG
jgi:hypothetical protein